MTSAEIMRTVRMFLDDSRDYFPTTAEVIKSVNEAQHERLHQAYLVQDERAMRILYAYQSNLSDGIEVVFNTTQRCLYPRSCRTRHLFALGTVFGEHVVYKDPATYRNINAREFAPTSTFPRDAYYTVTYTYSAGYKSYINITGTNAGASLWFVYDPPDFAYTGSGGDQTLSLPAEYHFEICAIAAELLNNMDVNELQRSKAAFQNQRIDIEKTAGV